MVRNWDSQSLAVPRSNFYGNNSGSGLPSLGVIATGGNVQQGSGEMPATAPAAAGDADRALMIGAMGHPGKWWASIAVLLVVLMYTAQHFDGQGNYANLKPTVYNVLTITLASIIGITSLKLLFTKFPVPGLSTVVLAA